MTRCAVPLFFAVLVSSNADTLTLRNGTRLSGSWVSLDAGQVSFFVDNQLRTYSKSEIVGVTFGAEAVAAPTNSTLPHTPAVSEPDIIGAVYFRDASGTLIPLERTTSVAQTNGRKGQYWDVSGNRSPVRVNNGQKMVFVVRLANGIDPSSFSLLFLETTKDSRHTIPDPKNKAGYLTIQLKVTKVGDYSYGMVPVYDLPAGEYAFSPSTSNSAYCFGVD